MLRRRRREPEPTASDDQASLLSGASAEDQRIVERAMPYSMTGAPRLLACIDAVRYCVARDLPGALVECGVWRGGSVLAMILTLQELGDSSREIYLYDTFEGMTQPTELDVSSEGAPALDAWTSAERENQRAWPELFGPEAFDEHSVRSLLSATGYPGGRLHFVRGNVEETLPAQAPEQICLLRLDTDWYESTRHEMHHLFPRLVTGGALLIDDYGHWEGARRAVDEYLGTHHAPLLLTRVDYTGRVAIKA